MTGRWSREALVLFLGAVVSAGCMPSLKQVRLPDPSTYEANRPTVEDAEGHPAVILRHDKRILLHAPGHRDAYTEIQEHQATVILAEDGFEKAEMRVWASEKAEFTNFQARTISPDGAVRYLRRDELIEDESEYSDETRLKMRIFHFPKVEVGSIIEYAYTLRWPRLRGVFSDNIVRDLPVRAYNLEIQGNNEVRYAVTAYQVDGQFKLDKGETDWKLSLQLKDMSPGPAASNDDWWPSKRLRRPWWVFRVPKLVFKAMVSKRVYKWYASWPNAVDYIIEKLYDEDELYKGYHVGVSSEGCGDRLCVIQRAMNLVRAQVEFDDFGTLGGADPVSEVVKRGRGDSFEKAITLWRVLTSSGVQAEYALAVRNFSNHLDKKFFWGGWFNHMVLRIPPQEGIEKTLWIDPSCEACALGQVSYRSLGADALVLRSEPEDEAEFEEVSGDEPPPNLYRLTHDVKLEANGTAAVTTELERRGQDAQWRRFYVRDWTEENWRKSAESFARRRTATYEDLQFTPGSCDRANGWCKEKLSFVAPAYGTQTGAEILVPLTLLHTHWDGRFDTPSRRYDVVSTAPDPSEEIVRIHIPDGYSVAALPEAVSGEVMGFRYQASAEVDGSTVVVRRSISNEMGRFPKGEYPKIRAVTQGYQKVPQWSVVLKRTGSGR